MGGVDGADGRGIQWVGLANSRLAAWSTSLPSQMYQERSLSVISSPIHSFVQDATTIHGFA
jgi:hypothetical protein